jgi:hypothetical protein
MINAVIAGAPCWTRRCSRGIHIHNTETVPKMVNVKSAVRQWTILQVASVAAGPDAKPSS